MENVGELPEGAKMCFDNGYFGGPNLRYLETKGLDGYIPDRKQAGEMKGNKPKLSPFVSRYRRLGPPKYPLSKLIFAPSGSSPTFSIVLFTCGSNCAWSKLFKKV